MSKTAFRGINSVKTNKIEIKWKQQAKVFVFGLRLNIGLYLKVNKKWFKKWCDCL
jgi:hypothetical protein